MKTRYSGIILTVLLASMFFLAGCKSTLLVHDATVKDTITILEDYAGTHGYKITYRNDELGSFRLSLGNVYIPERSETTKTKEITKQPPLDKNLPYTAYEETSWQTVSVPGHYVEATAMVTINQRDEDVIVVIDTSDAAGTSFSDIVEYIKGFGYVVDNK
ncbi:MAG: hypothetical protein WCT39_03255 [Candidatus Margulisiibacteriota bacterium]